MKDTPETNATMEDSPALDKCAPVQEKEASEVKDTPEVSAAMKDYSVLNECATVQAKESSEKKEASEGYQVTEDCPVMTKNTPEVDTAEDASDSAKSGLASTEATSTISVEEGVSDQGDSNFGVEEAVIEQPDEVVECLVPRLSDIIKAEIR